MSNIIFLLQNFRSLLKQIKNSAEAHIILDCNTEKIYEVLKQAQQIGMMSDYHSYLITSLDLQILDLDEFKYGGTNVTAFRLVDPDSVAVENTVSEWVESNPKVPVPLLFQVRYIESRTKSRTIFNSFFFFF